MDAPSKRLKLLLVEPKRCKKYYTSYPPLALLKLAAYHRRRGDEVKLVSDVLPDGFDPDVICVTSLFTYAWEPVHNAINLCLDKYPQAEVKVGGIYATLCADNLRQTFGDRIEIHGGLLEEVEDILPDYSLCPDWQASIVFSSRGCVNNCEFCSVAALEPEFRARKSIKNLIYQGHRKVVLWDNNFLASPYHEDILRELEEIGLEVDFNQGLEAQRLTREIVGQLAKLNISFVRLAYDVKQNKEHVRSAVELLKQAGFRGRRICVYCLYNHSDSPDDFLQRIRDLLGWGVVAYPMRYEPLKPGSKNSYVSPKWTAEQLDLVVKARRVIGYGGAFPPYQKLKEKFDTAASFEEAFGLRPRKDRG